MLFLHMNRFASVVDDDLRMLCGGALGDLSIDSVASTVTDASGKTVAVSPSGRVWFTRVTWPVPEPLGYGIVRKFAEATDFQILITGESPDYRWGVNPGDTLIAAGAVCSPPDRRTTAGVALVQIYYDATDCGTGVGSPGYNVVGATGASIASPRDVTLFHELIHAWHHFKNVYDPANAEIKAITGTPGENLYRAERGLPLRDTGPRHHEGKANCQLKPPPAGTPSPPASGTSRSCC